MSTPAWLWAVTIIGIIGIIAVDLVVVDRRPHPFGPREATRWVIFYVVLAAVFGIFVGWYFGITYAGQFVAGLLRFEQHRAAGGVLAEQRALRAFQNLHRLEVKEGAGADAGDLHFVDIGQHGRR